MVLRDDKIVQTSYLKETEVTLDDAKNEVRFCSEINDGKKILYLADISQVNKVPREVRKYYSSEAACKYIKAIVLVTSSPVSRVIGNFFLGLNKPPVPIRLFDSVDEGNAWLMEFINHE